MNKALCIGKQHLRPSHSLITYPLLTLVHLASEQNQYEQAEQLYWQALSIWEQTLAMAHPLMTDELSQVTPCVYTLWV